MFNRARSAVRNFVTSTAGRVSTGAAALVASAASHAEDGPLATAAKTALAGAEAQVGSTGTAVISCVVAVVIVGIVIACVRKA